MSGNGWVETIMIKFYGPPVCRHSSSSQGWTFVPRSKNFSRPNYLKEWSAVTALPCGHSGQRKQLRPRRYKFDSVSLLCMKSSFKINAKRVCCWKEWNGFQEETIFAQSLRFNLLRLKLLFSGKSVVLHLPGDLIKDTLLIERDTKKKDKRKKPSTRQDLNPRPRWHEACALPLCYNRCPGRNLFEGENFVANSLIMSSRFSIWILKSWYLRNPPSTRAAFQVRVSLGMFNLSPIVSNSSSRSQISWASGLGD